MFKRHGYVVADRATPQSRGDTLCLWNRKRGADETEADSWERRNGTVLVIENAYLQRVDKTFYSVSVGQHNGAGYFPVGDEDRFSKLGFEVKPWREKTDKTYTLVCSQRGIGSSLMASPFGWGERHAKALPGRVKLRPHPANHEARIPLEHDLANAHACHIWSSGAGVRALVEGVPVKHYAPHWICEDPDRLKALHRMSHGQWHFDEVATGEPLARILDQLEHATW